MKKCQVVFRLFLPPHQDSSGAIEPGMSAFHHPSPRSIARDGFFLHPLLTTTANMRLVVASKQFVVDGSGVIGRIQAQMLRRPLDWLWSTDNQTIEGDAQQFDIMAIGSRNDQSQGNPSSISQKAAFGSQFAAISGIRSGRGVAERGFIHGSIYCLPVPLDANQFIIGVQTRLPERPEEASSFPLLRKRS